MHEVGNNEGGLRPQSTPNVNKNGVNEFIDGVLFGQLSLKRWLVSNCVR